MQSGEPKTQEITWASVETAVLHLAGEIEAAEWKPELIVAVARGGFVPAVMLASRLDIHRLESLRFQRRTVNNLPPFMRNWDVPTTLIVDDICDEGATSAFFRTEYREAKFVSLFYKRKVLSILPANHLPHFLGTLVPEKWIIFPWDLGTTDNTEELIPF